MNSSFVKGFVAALLLIGLGLGGTGLLTSGETSSSPERATAPAPSAPVDGETYGVAAVVDGDTITLVNGRDVRFTGIQTPKLPLGRKGFKKWPLADEAKVHLFDLIGEGSVTLQLAANPEDRWGRILAQVYNDKGEWLQGEMISAGMGRVYTFADNAEFAEALYAREREARAAGRGIWAHPFYAIRTPDEAHEYDESFQLVEGRVVEAANVRGRVYLNFGADYKTDFTILVEPEVRRQFDARGIDLTSLTGHPVRVRGWLRDWNGPLIELTHPEQLEILGHAADD